MLELRPRVPRLVWDVLRALVLAGAVALVVLLVVSPSLGRQVFWRGVIPTLPALFFLAPGFWRNVCPLATANQIPRRLGFTRAGTAPRWFQRNAFLIGAGLLFVLVPTRRLFFNGSGWGTALLLAAALVSGFAGGVLLKGKSGWCGSICPLLPVQRLYGQTPFALVRNSHCEPCIGCTANCFDFNQHVAQVADLNDADRAPARKLFAGAFPGLVVGYFTAGGGLDAYGRVAVGALIGIGALFALDVVLRPRPATLTALSGATALNLFYWFALPTLVSSPWIVWPERVALAVLTAVWLVRTARKERALAAEVAPEPAVRADAGAIAAAGAGGGLPEVTVAGRRVAVQPRTTLLEIAERNGVALEAGCRMGMCGADPVCVVSGGENLSPMESAERATLERLGLGEGMRLACCARVSGPVEFSLDTRPAAAALDGAPAGDPSVRRVVIVGNGIAGVTAADHVRRNHATCEIDVVGREPHHLYNRMAITRLIYGRTAMQGLYLLPDAWYESNRITPWLNTHVEAIDRAERTVQLATGETLTYDRLILTSGSSGFVPGIEGFGASGTYALRTADDAMSIRAEVQRHRARDAVVAGGGLLGLEAAYALHKLGLRVTVVQRSGRLLGRQLDETGSAYLRAFLEGLGFEFALPAEVVRVVAEDRVRRVVLSNGNDLACDLLLVTAGIVPNEDLPREAGLAVGRGVIVDDAMRTSDPSVFAAGDVAEHRGVVSGLWPAAVEQGRVAAVNAAGGDERYVPVAPATILKITGVDLTSVGRFEEEPGDEVVALEDPAEQRYRKLVVRDGRAVGGILLGYPLDAAALTAAVQEERDVSAVLPALRAGDWSVLAEAPAVAAA
jgi:NADPH-dependent 2,4-dienoyl-CoA reductase/sulfur reductase-like enzyme/ferredoxin